MAYKNKLLSNPKTGQTIRFLQTAGDTNGRLLEMESTLPAHSGEPPLHYHPQQAETFIVISGELSVKLNGHMNTYRPGQQFNIPRNTVHSMWNQGNIPTVVNWIVTPALDTESFLEMTMGLAIDGKTNDRGMPPLLQIALLAKTYDHVFRLAKPPHAIQKIIFTLLIPFAYLAGYRGTYSKYLN